MISNIYNDQARPLLWIENKVTDKLAANMNFYRSYIVIRYIIGLFVMLGLIACGRKAQTPKEKLPVPVDVIIAEKVNFPSSVEVNGVTLSEEMIELHPEISGRLTYLNIPDGATVKAGTVLAKINDADLQAQLEQQKVQLDLANKTEKRLKELLAVNGVNQSDYDVALSQVNTINANIKVLNAQIDKTIVRAPFSGKLGLRMVSPGAYVSSQTLLGTLHQSDKIKIDFTVPEFYENLVKVGNTVIVETNESDEKQTAVISAIEPQINVETRNVKVRAMLESGNVSPGTFVKVLITKKEIGIVVPSNALIPDASSNQVVIVRKNKAVFVNVETGIRNADVVELLKGINSGDTVIVSGVLFVRPNALVKIGKVKTQSFESAPDSNLVVK
jgi:membrane fusion protein (multidrug efflux system)